MGECRQNQPNVKLFFALMTNRDKLFEEAERLLSEDFGPVDMRDAVYDFDPFTQYYAPEFGRNLKKRIFAVEKMIPPEQLVSIKRRTNEMESDWSEGSDSLSAPSLRTINIDPGYLNLSKVVLATTKDHSHRIYIGQGIFEEITLTYRKSPGFQSNPWTYPDYGAPERLDFFNKLRQVYCAQIGNAQTEKPS